MTPRALLFLCAVLAVALAFAPARAQPRQASGALAPAESAARDAFEAGRSAYDIGRFEEALTHYERAYALSPRPMLLFNIARAADADGQGARAIGAYSEYLRLIPDAENRAFVEARLGKLEGARMAQGDASPPAAASALPATARTADAAARPAPPTAAAVAASLESPALELASGPQRDSLESSPPLWKRGWLWGVVGATVAAAAATAVVLSIDREPQRTKADEYIMPLVQR